MATAATPAAADAAEAPPPPTGGKKKLLIIGAAALALLLAGGGGAAWYLVKQRRAEAAAAEAGEAPQDQQAHQKKKQDKKHTPVFLPLDMFTVNLADREAERYAQVGVTLEVADTGTSDKLKTYMPAIRNDILMLLAHKRADELQEREGKIALAAQIKRAASRPLLDQDDGAKGDTDDEPVRAVHFSAFIIQ